MVAYDLSQLSERYRIDRIVLSTTLASFVVLLFDHILTIGDEVKYIWKRKFTVISGLFLLNRYFTLITMVVYLAGVTSMPMTLVDRNTINSPTNIHPIEVIVVLSIISVLIAEIMLILRVSAVYRNNKAINVCLIFLWTFHLIMMVYVTIKASHYLPENHISKILFIGSPPGRLFVVFVVPAVIFDTVVGALLVFGLYWKSGPFRQQMPLVNLIMRDGTIYFIVVFASNIAWILTQAFLLKTHVGPHGVFRESDLTPLEIWSACITTTMIGRLTLNLRRYNAPNNEEVTITRLRFRTANSQQPTDSEYAIETQPSLARRVHGTSDSREGMEISTYNAGIDRPINPRHI